MHYISPQEDPYLFTYRNSNYLPRLPTPQAKFEVWRGFLQLTNMQMRGGTLLSLWNLPRGSLCPRLERVKAQVCGCALGVRSRAAFQLRH